LGGNRLFWVVVKVGAARPPWRNSSCPRRRAIAQPGGRIAARLEKLGCGWKPLYSAVLRGYNAGMQPNDIVQDILAFCEFGKTTRVIETIAATFGGELLRVPTYVNEFWTAKQRAAHSLHEISYRACFKPQLPRFFIQRLPQPEDIVYDPFNHD
jgi:hypothetical protein